MPRHGRILLCLAAVCALWSERARAQAIVRGEVFDSLLTNGPLVGATVLVQGTTRMATTDKRGRFVLRDVPAGRHTFGFFHPLLDSLRVGAPVRVVEIGERGTVNVVLATPSPGTLSVRVCGTPADPATAVIFGFARSAEDGSPLNGAEARVGWFELEMQGTESRQVGRVASARTNAEGLYLLCGVPNDIELSLVVVQGEQSSGPLHLALGAAGIARHDVTVSLSDSAARVLPQRSVTDTMPRARPAGSARLRVLVRSPQGRPVRGAIVGLRGTEVSGVSPPSGVVSLIALPAGSQTLAVRAIGLSPHLQVVSLVPAEELVLEVQLERFATMLPTVAVRGVRDDALDQAIARRRQSGWGYYFDGPALRGAAAGLGFWAVIPGMSIGGSSGSDAMPLMRTGFNNYCVPEVWFDGFRQSMVDGWELRALLLNARRMEVFTRASRVPGEYMSGAAQACGAILIWTR